MNCDSLSKLIPLYYYGELSPEEEDRIDQHLHECAACSTAMERQRALAAALDRRQLEVSPLLLEDCRADLMAAIAGGAPRAVKASKTPWTLFLEALNLSFAGFGQIRRPLAYVTLVLLGFVAARISGPLAGGAGPSLASVANADNVYSNVRSVKTDDKGMVSVTYDETRRHEISGRLDDANIRKLVLAGSHEENPAVRVASVDLLKNNTDNDQVVDVLLNSLYDPNDGVRLKVLEALRPLAGNPKVVKALAQILPTDPNPAVRMAAIDLMVTRRDDAVVGVLQNLMQREDNSGVRLKAGKVLKDWHASQTAF